MIAEVGSIAIINLTSMALSSRCESSSMGDLYFQQGFFSLELVYHIVLGLVDKRVVGYALKRRTLRALAHASAL